MSCTQQILKSLLVLAVVALATGCSTLPSTTDDAKFLRQFGNFEYCAIDVVKQQGQLSCGTACIAAVLSYWGKEVDESYVLEAYPPRNGNGYFLWELRDIGQKEGCECFAVSLSENPLESLLEQIAKGRPVPVALRCPQGEYFARRVPVYGRIFRHVINAIGIRQDHYVVVFGFDSENVLIMDPSYGYVAWSKKQFLRRWQKQDYAALICAIAKQPLEDEKLGANK